MSAVLLYSIKSAIVLAMLYLPYMLMLRRESFFRFNRMVLLSILLLSLVLPLCNVPWMSLDHQPVVQAAQLQMLELGIPVHVLPEVQVLAEKQEESFFTFSLFHLFTFIYIIGMVALLAARLWQIARLQFGMKKGVLWHSDEQGVRIYCHSDNVAPFSWMRQMLQWWNPLCYVLGISLRDVHEYEADNFVLEQGVSAQGYQLLLIRKAVGSGGYPFANSFNHSLTKKRITMMKKIKSNPWMKSKALYVIPVAALALSAFATPKFVAPIEETVSKLEGKGTENSANLQTSEEKRKVVELKNVSKVLVDGKEMTPQEAMEAVKGKEIQNSLITQPDGSEALSIKTRGTKDALIVLNGKILEIPKDAARDINSEEQLTKLLNIDPEDVESITVLQKDAAIAKWGDKGANGAIVINTKSKDDVKDLVKKLPGAKMDDEGNITVNGKSIAKIMLNDKEVFNNNDTIYNVVKERAKFPGGDEECYKFLAQNVRYPKLCQEFGVQGRVIVRFVIEKDGSISHIEKIRAPSQALTEVTVQTYKKEHPDSEEQLEPGQDLGDLLFEEAKRVMELMPKWEPGKDEDGNAVRSIFSLPVMFRLR